MSRPVMLACLALTACRLDTGEYFGHVPEPDPTHLHWCTDDPAVLDPATSMFDYEYMIDGNLFDPLTTFQDRPEAAPALASRWDSSPDFRTFTFYLRPNTRFSNGRPLTAEDVRYSVTRVLHPLNGSWIAPLLGVIRHARAYSAGTAKRMMVDHEPFGAGEDVKLVASDAADPNLRVLRSPVQLHTWPEAESEAYATLATGAEVTLVELSQDHRWAYVYHTGSNGGVYGWLEQTVLDNPNANRTYRVVALDDVGDAPRTADVPGRDLLGLPEILGIEVIDAHTIAFHLEQPTPHFPILASYTNAVAREAVSRWPRSWYRPEHIITSGPFHLAEWRPRNRLELVRSETYWNRAQTRLERVTIHALHNSAARANLYYAGFCDIADYAPASYNAMLKGAGARDLHSLDLASLAIVSLDTRIIESAAARRALASALDRRELTGFLKDVRPTGQWSPGYPVSALDDATLAACGIARDYPGTVVPLDDHHCFAPPVFPRFDPVAARRELERAEQSGHGLPDNLTIVHSGSPWDRPVAEWLQASWSKNLGVEVGLEGREAKTYSEELFHGSGFPIAIVGWALDIYHPGTFLHTTTRCGDEMNPSRFCDAEHDRLLALASAESDLARRVELFEQAEQRLADEVPGIPLFNFETFRLEKPYVRDVGLKNQLHDAWIDPDWRQAE